MRSKGVSQIVASVLIILIVLVATGMMWVVIKTFLSNTSDNVGGVDCISASVQPVSCIYDSGTKRVSVIVHRGTGASSVSGLSFVFSNSAGSFVNQQISDIQELETRNYTFYYPDNFVIPQSVDVGAKLGDLVCNPSLTPIVCNEGSVAEQSCTPDQKYPCEIDGKVGQKICLPNGIDYGECVAACGDGFYEPLLGEECDASDPNDPNKDKCTNECKLQVDNGGWGPIANDCGALYSGDPNRGALKINIDQDKQNFEVVRGSDNAILKQKIPTNQQPFFISPGNNAATVTYSIEPDSLCPGSGVDVVYTVKNNKNQQISIPQGFSFSIPGIKQSFTQNAEYLYDNDYGNLLSMFNPQHNLDDNYLGKSEVDRIEYPGVYSPVIVTNGDSFAAGSSIMYPYLDYKHSVVMYLKNDKSTNTWTYRYSNFTGDDGAITLVPGQYKQYKVSLTFTKSEGDYWIFTLAPYKKFFDDTYHPAPIGVKQKDLRPIRGVQLADGTNCAGNSRFYCSKATKYHLLENGWQDLLEAFASIAKSDGFKRTIIWLPSGAYDDANCPLKDKNGNIMQYNQCNFPPQFMDFLPGKLVETDHYFKDIVVNKYGLTLGFWWGRNTATSFHADGTPMGVNDWNPDYVQVTGLTDVAKGFAFRQLDSALARGTTLIGLDAFSGGYEKYNWVDELRSHAQSKGVNNLILAGEASQSDLYHTKIANYFSPCKHAGLAEADYLSYYLNPGAEIWVQYGSSFTDKYGKLICNGEDHSSKAYLEKAVGQGYTIILKTFDPSQSFPQVGQISDYSESECFDGKSNDADGLVDFPFDPECTSFMDDNEAA